MRYTREVVDHGRLIYRSARGDLGVSRRQDGQLVCRVGAEVHDAGDDDTVLATVPAAHFLAACDAVYPERAEPGRVRASVRLGSAMVECLRAAGQVAHLVHEENGAEVWAERILVPPAPSGLDRFSARRVLTEAIAAPIARLDNIAASARFRAAEVIAELDAGELSVRAPPDTAPDSS